MGVQARVDRCQQTPIASITQCKYNVVFVYVYVPHHRLEKSFHDQHFSVGSSDGSNTSKKVIRSINYGAKFGTNIGVPALIDSNVNKQEFLESYLGV